MLAGGVISPLYVDSHRSGGCHHSQEEGERQQNLRVCLKRTRGHTGDPPAACLRRTGRRVGDPSAFFKRTFFAPKAAATIPTKPVEAATSIHLFSRTRARPSAPSKYRERTIAASDTVVAAFVGLGVMMTSFVRMSTSA